MNNVLTVSQLTKSYNKNKVLNNLSFEVKKGEVFGILGMNGAGKTTLLECIEGYKKYDSGNIQIHGTIGIQLQTSSLPSYMKVKEALVLFSKWNKTNIDTSLITALNIHDIENKTYTQLSTGQKRRLHLLLALFNHPDILFLDEPTAGLDVEGRIELHEVIRQLQKQGTTIIMTSHDMNEVESLCDRIVILHHGTHAYLGTIDELKKAIHRHHTIQIITKSHVYTYTTHHVAQTLLNILQDFKEKNIDIQDIKLTQGTLEEHLIYMTKE